MERLTLEMKDVDGLLGRFANQIGAVGEGQARIAMSRAINRAVDMSYTQVVRALVKQTSIPRALLVSQISKNKSAQLGTGPLVGSIYATGSELPLSKFRPVQFSWGVRAKVWGKVERFPHAFIFGGTFRNKAAPIAGNAPEYHVFVRNGRTMQDREGKKGRDNAFAELFGPSIPKEMVKDAAAETFLRVSREALIKRLSVELNHILG